MNRLFDFFRRWRKRGLCHALFGVSPAETAAMKKSLKAMRKELAAAKAESAQAAAMGEALKAMRAELAAAKAESADAERAAMTAAAAAGKAESDFKGEIKKVRTQIVDSYRDARYLIYKYLPAERRQEAIDDWWKAHVGRVPDWDAPRTFNDKIQWLKLHGTTPLMTRLADKFAVREWVAEKVGERYLIPLLGVWDRPEDIEFDRLPARFVLKATHASGWNIVVRDRRRIREERIRELFRKWLATDFAFYGTFEMHYSGIKPRIVAEEYVENTDNDLNDYKFWCFGGRCEYVQFLSKRRTGGLDMAFFDRDWNLMPFVYDHPRNPSPPPRPDNLEEMIGIAEKLSEGFPHVRVDLYRLNDGSIRFGELTFMSASGTAGWDPPEWNARLGELFSIPADGGPAS